MKFNENVARKFGGTPGSSEVEKADLGDTENPNNASGAAEAGPRNAASDPMVGQNAALVAEGKGPPEPRVHHGGNPNSPDYVDEEQGDTNTHGTTNHHTHVQGSHRHLTPHVTDHDSHNHLRCPTADLISPMGSPRLGSWSLAEMRDHKKEVEKEAKKQENEQKAKEADAGEGGAEAKDKEKDAKKPDDGDEEDTLTGWRRFLQDPLLIVWKLVMPKKERYWLLFSSSIFNIALCTYLMVDAVNRIGCNLGISPLFMGLVFLSAGTSVPDALGSIAVAREGEGDMAVANAFGSNVFDILLGLGVPWLLKACMGVEVSFKGTADSLVEWMAILFAILVLFLGALICNKWKLNKRMGVVLMTFYVLYVGVALIRAFLK